MDDVEETGKDLSMMNIKPLRDVTNVNQSQSGDVEIYKKLLSQGKRQAAEGHPKQALETFQRAVKLSSNEKILKKIAKLEAFIKEYGQSSEEEEEDSAMVHVGKGFYLHRDLYSKLYPHQQEGVLWFWRLHRKKKGGILGDDMGLGKTIQVVSFLSGLFDADAVKSVMIILPVALILNWEREFEKWAPGIRVETFHTDSKHQRQRALDKVQRRGGVLLISYGLVVTNCENLRTHNCRQFTWDYVILDEGHKIKNPTKTTKAVHAVPAHHRFILSGTPVQNNLKELWSLFDFVCQGTLLGTRKTFCTMYENPITRAREKCGTASQKRLGNEMAESLRKLIAPHFLRRTKADVKRAKQASAGNEDAEDGKGGTEMPTLTRKNDLIVWMHLSQPQIQIYQEFLSLDRVKELLMTTRSPLVELTILKKICDHPRLLSTMACQQLGLAGDADFEDANESQQKECAANLVNQIPDNVLLDESGKLQFLMGLLEKLRCEGHRTLVFSQSRKMLDIIQKLLWSRDIKFLRLDGTIRKLEEREQLIKSFQENDAYSVFLLTTQVGGVGLTLTAADRVVVFDPHWNPATDNQAVDRVYRIGQTRSVVIYRLITCGSVEEKIYRRQVFKDSITRQTTGDSKNPYRYFTRQQMHELFVLDDPQVSTTQQQLEELHTGHRITDPTLDDHIAYLYSLGIFGLSDHDLMFSQEAIQETADSHANESIYIHETVQRAQNLVANECQQIKEHCSDGRDVNMVDVDFDGKEVTEEVLNSTMESLTLQDYKEEHNSTQEMIEDDVVIDLTDDSHISTESNHQQTDPRDQNKIQSQASPKMEFIDLTEDEEDSFIKKMHHHSNMESIPAKRLSVEGNSVTLSYSSSPSNLPRGNSEQNSSKRSSVLQDTDCDISETSCLSTPSPNDTEIISTVNSTRSLAHCDLSEINKDCDMATEASGISTPSPNDTEIISTANSDKSAETIPSSMHQYQSPYGFIRPSDASATQSPACNLLRSNRTLSAQNSPAATGNYVVSDSDEENYASSTGTSRNNSASQDDAIINDSFAEMDTSDQKIESDGDQDQKSDRISGLQKFKPIKQLQSPHQQTSEEGVEALEESIMETEEEADGSLAEDDVEEEDVAEGRMEEREEGLTEDEDLTEGEEEEEVERSSKDKEEYSTEEDDEDIDEEEVKSYKDKEEYSTEEDDEDIDEEEVEKSFKDKEEDLTEEEEDEEKVEKSYKDKEEDLTEEEDEEESVERRVNGKEEDLTDEGEGDDIGDETLSDEDDEDNSINEFINDDEEEDTSGTEESEYDSEDEEEDLSDEEEEDDPMYIQLVKEGRNQEKGGNMKRALKCYLKALEIESKDKSLQLHAYKLARTIKSQQKQL